MNRSAPLYSFAPLLWSQPGLPTLARLISLGPQQGPGEGKDSPLCQSYHFLPAASGQSQQVAFMVSTDAPLPHALRGRLLGWLIQASYSMLLPRPQNSCGQKLVEHTGTTLLPQWQPLALATEGCRLPQCGELS